MRVRGLSELNAGRSVPWHVMGRDQPMRVWLAGGDARIDGCVEGNVG